MYVHVPIWMSNNQYRCEIFTVHTCTYLNVQYPISMYKVDIHCKTILFECPMSNLKITTLLSFTVVSICVKHFGGSAWILIGNGLECGGELKGHLVHCVVLFGQVSWRPVHPLGMAILRCILLGINYQFIIRKAYIDFPGTFKESLVWIYIFL